MSVHVTAENMPAPGGHSLLNMEVPPLSELCAKFGHSMSNGMNKHRASKICTLKAFIMSGTDTLITWSSPKP